MDDWAAFIQQKPNIRRLSTDQVESKFADFQSLRGSVAYIAEFSRQDVHETVIMLSQIFKNRIKEKIYKRLDDAVKDSLRSETPS